MADNVPEPILRDPSIGVRSFSARLAGRPADDVLRPGVSPALQVALQEWVEDFVKIGAWNYQIVSRAASRLDSPPRLASRQSGMLLLDIIDQVIDLVGTNHKDNPTAYQLSVEAIRYLNNIFADHRSLYTVGAVERESRIGLVTRVDPTIKDAVSQTIEQGNEASGRHLSMAWHALHQLHPDPDVAYRHAVQAIEAALGPLVLPTANGPTLGQIKSALVNGRWGSVLDRTGPAGKRPTIAEAANSSIVFLVDLLERVYGTQVRHSDTDEQRTQTESQAAAAVYAAVAILGWTQNDLLARP